MKADEPNGVEVSDPEHNATPEQAADQIEAGKPLFSKIIMRDGEGVGLHLYGDGETILIFEHHGERVTASCDLESLVDLSYIIAQVLSRVVDDKDLVAWSEVEAFTGSVA